MLLALALAWSAAESQTETSYTARLTHRPSLVDRIIGSPSQQTSRPHCLFNYLALNEDHMLASGALLRHDTVRSGKVGMAW